MAVNGDIRMHSMGNLFLEKINCTFRSAASANQSLAGYGCPDFTSMIFAVVFGFWICIYKSANYGHGFCRQEGRGGVSG